MILTARPNSNGPSSRIIFFSVLPLRYSWGGGHLLPYGRLREPLSQLRRADCVVLTRTDQGDNVEGIVNQLTQLSGGRPLFRSSMRSVAVESLHQGPVDLDLTRYCFAFCAVGNPSSFFRQLKNFGCNLVSQKAFVDHHCYTQDEIGSLELSAKQAGAQCLITTEKDAVKLRDLTFSLPCYVLKIEIAIEDSQGLERLILNAGKK